MTSTIRRAVGDGLSNCTVESVETQNTRPGNETAYVEFANREAVYVKVATDTPARLRREIAATRHAGTNASVNVPHVVAANPDAEPPYMITTPLSGELMNDQWTAGEDREELMQAVGATVAATHDAQFAETGIIESWDDDHLQLKPMNWTDTLCSTVRRRAEDWFSDRFAELPEELIATIRTIEPTLDETSPTLLHGDPSRINIHLDPSGLLDWERALVGDPAFDLVETVFHHLDQPDVADTEKPALRDALYEGYRDQRGFLPEQLDTYEPLYRAIAHLLAPQTFDDWAPSVNAPLSELETKVRQEAHSRMSAAEDALL